MGRKNTIMFTSYLFIAMSLIPFIFVIPNPNYLKNTDIKKVSLEVQFNGSSISKCNITDKNCQNYDWASHIRGKDPPGISPIANVTPSTLNDSQPLFIVNSPFSIPSNMVYMENYICSQNDLFEWLEEAFIPFSDLIPENNTLVQVCNYFSIY